MWFYFARVHLALQRSLFHCCFKSASFTTSTNLRLGFAMATLPTVRRSGSGKSSLGGLERNKYPNGIRSLLRAFLPRRTRVTVLRFPMPQQFANPLSTHQQATQRTSERVLLPTWLPAALCKRRSSLTVLTVSTPYGYDSTA
jgi:hypothetical protein